MTPFPLGYVNRASWIVLVLAPLLFCSALGCAHTSSPGATFAESPRSKVKGEVQVPATVVTPTEALSADALFERGLKRFEQRQYSLAAMDLEAAAMAMGRSPHAALGWYRAGIARDEAGALALAAADFSRAIALDEGSALAREARVRLMRLQVFMERWADAGEEARRMQQECHNLTSIESIVVKGALALDALLRNDLDAAAREIERARTIIEENQFDAAAQLQRDVAVIYFALGELRRLRGAQLRFVPLPANFADQLENRCQLLLDAQSAYSTAMRAYDAHWSVMAGYRVGQLYEDLHHDLMEMLNAVELTQTGDRQLFEAALRLRYTILLEKSASSLEHTLALAARTEDDSKWVGLARQALAASQRSISEERAAIARVPYTRDQLLQAIERLGTRRRPSRPKN